MVHLSMDTWCPTYAWSRPLAEYMPTTARPLLEKPVLLSFALWNNRSNPDSPDITRGRIRSPNTLLSDRPTTNKHQQRPDIPTTTESHRHLTQQNGTSVNQQFEPLGTSLQSTLACNDTSGSPQWMWRQENTNKAKVYRSILVSDGTRPVHMPMETLSTLLPTATAPHTCKKCNVTMDMETKPPILSSFARDMTTRSTEGKSTTEYTERLVKYRSITVNDSYLQELYAKGNLDAQLPFTTSIHYLPPRKIPVLTSLSGNVAHSSCSDAIPTRAVVLAVLLLLLPIPSAPQRKLEVPPMDQPEDSGRLKGPP